MTSRNSPTRRRPPRLPIARFEKLPPSKRTSPKNDSGTSARIHGPLPSEAGGHTSAAPQGEASPERGRRAAFSVPAACLTPSEPLDRNKERTITVKEAAFRLNKSADAIYLWLRAGRLRGWQPGGPRCAILVAEASVQEALLCPLSAYETV